MMAEVYALKSERYQTAITKTCSRTKSFFYESSRSAQRNPDAVRKMYMYEQDHSADSTDLFMFCELRAKINLMPYNASSHHRCIQICYRFGQQFVLVAPVKFTVKLAHTA